MTSYAYPDTLEEALELLEDSAGKARILAGGTDLMPDLRRGKIQPGTLIDITRIPDLKKIQVGSSRIRVGAAVTFAAIKDHPQLQSRVPVLCAAAASIGAGAIQQAATWGGNLVQAMPAADGAVAALALEAEAELLSPDGFRSVPVEELFLGPGLSAVDPTREILTAVEFPACPEGSHWGFSWQRIGRRPALVLPILNCAVKLQLIPGKGPPAVKKAVIGLGPAAPHPLRAREAETYLTGRKFTPEAVRGAALRVRDQAHPRSSLMRASREYRLEIIPGVISRALEEAARTAGFPDLIEKD